MLRQALCVCKCFSRVSWRSASWLGVTCVEDNSGVVPRYALLVLLEAILCSGKESVILRSRTWLVEEPRAKPVKELFLLFRSNPPTEGVGGGGRKRVPTPSPAVGRASPLLGRARPRQGLARRLGPPSPRCPCGRTKRHQTSSSPSTPSAISPRGSRSRPTGRSWASLTAGAPLCGTLWSAAWP